jgi:hypothetical protein
MSHVRGRINRVVVQSIGKRSLESLRTLKINDRGRSVPSLCKN